MPNKPKATSNTSGAKVMRQGHTTDGNYGSDPSMKGKGQKPVRDLKAR